MHQPEKSKHEETPRRKNWGRIIAGGVLFCVGLLGCFATLWGTAYWPTCAAMPFPFYTDIEKNAFFELPPSAHSLEYDSQVSSRSCVIWVQFEMDSADLKLFQDSTLIQTFNTTGIEDTGGFMYFMEEKGWTQTADSINELGRFEGYIEDGHIRQWLLIYSTDAHSLIVRIIVSKNWR